MPSPSWENLDDFLDPEEFAVTALVEDEDGGAVIQVVGIFDDPYMNAELGEFDMDSSKPRLLCKEAALAGVQRGARVTIGAKVYDVMTGPQSTGDGMAVLTMAEVP